MDIKTNKELNAFRGFTLIELLAVIVVLAIIILIAVQAVLPQMDKARRSALAIEANQAIQSAQSYFTAGDLMGGDTLPAQVGSWKCISIHDLIDQGFYDADKNEYYGTVYVKKGSNNYFYRVYLHNDEYMIISRKGGTAGEGAGVDSWSSPNENININLDDVENYDNAKWKSSYGECEQASGSSTTSGSNP